MPKNPGMKKDLGLGLGLGANARGGFRRAVEGGTLTDFLGQHQRAGQRFNRDLAGGMPGGQNRMAPQGRQTTAQGMQDKNAAAGGNAGAPPGAATGPPGGAGMKPQGAGGAPGATGPPGGGGQKGQGGFGGSMGGGPQNQLAQNLAGFQGGPGTSAVAPYYGPPGATPPPGQGQGRRPPGQGQDGPPAASAAAAGGQGQSAGGAGDQAQAAGGATGQRSFQDTINNIFGANSPFGMRGNYSDPNNPIYAGARRNLEQQLALTRARYAAGGAGQSDRESLTEGNAIGDFGAQIGQIGEQAFQNDAGRALQAALQGWQQLLSQNAQQAGLGTGVTAIGAQEQQLPGMQGLLGLLNALSGGTNTANTSSKSSIYG